MAMLSRPRSLNQCILTLHWQGLVRQLELSNVSHHHCFLCPEVFLLTLDPFLVDLSPSQFQHHCIIKAPEYTSVRGVGSSWSSTYSARAGVSWHPALKNQSGPFFTASVNTPMSSRFLATKRSVFVGKGSTDAAYRILTAIMRSTGLMRKVYS